MRCRGHSLTRINRAPGICRTDWPAAWSDISHSRATEEGQQEEIPQKASRHLCTFSTVGFFHRERISKLCSCSRLGIVRGRVKPDYPVMSGQRSSTIYARLPNDESQGKKPMATAAIKSPAPYQRSRPGIDWGDYDPGDFYDEIISSPGNARAAARSLVSFVRKMSMKHLASRQQREAVAEEHGL